MTKLKKGDSISFMPGSRAERDHPSAVWEVVYVNKGCDQNTCPGDDCDHKPFVVVRSYSQYGFPLEDVKMIYDPVTHAGRMV